MKSEQEIIEELRRAKIAQRKLDGEDDSDKSSKLMSYQTALLWVIDEVDTTELDVVESLLRLRDRETQTDE